MKKQRVSKKQTQAQQSITSCKSLILSGTLLAIDPSSGSRGSMPGYAFFRAGVCEEWGIIQLDHKQSLKEKLWNLGNWLRVKYPKVDVLIMENIPPFMSSAGTGFKNAAVVNLHKSIGAVFSAVYSSMCIEVTPQSWHAWLRHKGLEDTYDKNDANDALILALYTLENAGHPIDWREYISN